MKAWSWAVGGCHEERVAVEMGNGKCKISIYT
jgi:hypothetical protein